MRHTKLEQYLVSTGFSGTIALNSRTLNYQAIKKMAAGDPFYTFGIKAIEYQAKRSQIKRSQVRDILVEASGLTVKRFRWAGPGYFDPAKSAAALIAAMGQIEEAATRQERIAFGTGHPGAMTGLLSVLAGFAKDMGAQIVTIDTPLVRHRAYQLDMIGPVLVASDNASNWHTHDSGFMKLLLDQTTPDLVVADHGYAGAALNAGIPTIGFYDTDDPAIPYAAAMGLPVLGVPLNDNRYNLPGSQLAEMLVKLVHA